MRVYEYDSAVYSRKVTTTGVFCALILLYSVYSLFFGNNMILWIGAGIISFYTVWETFISLSNPSKVIVDADSITFCAYGREHRYLWSEIERFKVKEFTGARKLFVRINKAGILRGRYWVNCYYFNDTDLLYKYIVDREYLIHPTSLKARARETGERDREEMAEKRKKKQEEAEKRQAEKQARKEARKKSGK
ncbi:MAG: hypothetical protein HFI39_07845 [Lachnospiraceae bacterium]|nr:hypothetical protein [Lachnospiraceae bacterium]